MTLHVGTDSTFCEVGRDAFPAHYMECRVMFRSRLTLCGFVFIGATLGVGPTFADEADSANYVMQGCRHYMNFGDNVDPFRQGWCGGIIAGLTFFPPDSTCLPAGVTRAQVTRVTVQYIDSRPARMHEDFRILALEAMKAAWPCQR